MAGRRVELQSKGRGMHWLGAQQLGGTGATPRFQGSVVPGSGTDFLQRVGLFVSLAVALLTALTLPTPDASSPAQHPPGPRPAAPPGRPRGGDGGTEGRNSREYSTTTPRTPLGLPKSMAD